MSRGRAVNFWWIGLMGAVSCGDAARDAPHVDRTGTDAALPGSPDVWSQDAPRTPGSDPTAARDTTVDATPAREVMFDGAPSDVADPGAPRGDDGWKLVWSDEFEGAAERAVDRTKWKFDLGGGGWGNGELQSYTDRTTNAALDGAGRLAITARREALGGAAYTSARLITQGLGSWQYGRFEARVQVPTGQGLWPAFWLLGDNLVQAGWPACGEIDIMENIGREPSILHATIHGPGYSAAAGPTSAYSLPSGQLSEDFHVFAVEWEVGAIRWYLDGQVYASKTMSDLPSGSRWVFDHPFFIILNLAVGGAWPGPPDATTILPQRLLVDYVRVYQR